MDVLITEDGAEIYLYSMNPQRQHGMVLQEGPDVNFENGTIVFTDANARAAFAGDTQGSTVFVVSENTTLKTGMYTIGTEFNLWDRLKHLFLPVTMGMVGWVAWYSRFLRSSMLDVINQDYIRTARAKGQTERKVLYRHALNNALIPLVTMFALDFPYIFAGSLVVELIFSWPGMGRLYYDAATFRDYPILLGILIIGASLIIISNLLADIGYAYLDPRVRYE
jgi:peptide/nickel transport system permease protein